MLFQVSSAVVPKHYSMQLDFCKQKYARAGDRAVNNEHRVNRTILQALPHFWGGHGEGTTQNTDFFFFFYRWFQCKLMLRESIGKPHCSLATCETTVEI